MPNSTKSYVFCYVCLLILVSCSPKDNSVSNIAKEYYKTYRERSDFDKFMGFYDENVVLEDMITADRIEGKQALRDFFDWNNPNFSKASEDALVIQEQIIQDNMVVTKGYFREFFWGKTKFGPMHFTTILTFNSSGKITKQVDWINYPSNLVDYAHRKDSNTWISK